MLYLVTTLVLLVYLVLVWLLGRWLPLHGSDVWILRGVLAVLGIVGAAVAYFYVYKVNKAKEPAAEGDAQSSGTDDLDALVQEAVRRLKHSTLGRGTNLGSLPLVFVLGDSGSTKTTVLIHSALDPELLAGQVYRDNEVLATSNANIWYTRQAIFVDPAGSMMGQADRWRRLVRLLQPGRFSAAIGKRAQAPRAAIVCFDCETFLQPGASETAVSAARRFSVRLQEVSQLLGISFPVYVLFTKLDRISFFTEFVRGMSKDEASEVLGATLPLHSLSAGVYADEETKRLTKAFDEIFYSLAERRILLLPREHEGEKLPAIYEFPRELQEAAHPAGAVSGGPGASQPPRHESFPAWVLLYRRPAGRDGRRGGSAGRSGGSGRSGVRWRRDANFSRRGFAVAGGARGGENAVDRAECRSGFSSPPCSTMFW